MESVTAAELFAKLKLHSGENNVQIIVRGQTILKITNGSHSINFTKRTKSQAEAIVEESDLSECTKRRKLREVQKEIHHVPVERRSAKKALELWRDRQGNNYHWALFALTILMRCLAAAVPKLRKTMSMRLIALIVVT